jgi:hypothetical protein
MYPRFLISMTITVAFSLALLAQTASAKPISAQTPYLSEGTNVVVPQKSDSQKPASMSYAEYRALIIRSEAFNRKYGVAHHALASSSKPTSMSNAEYRALMLRGEGLNQKYGVGQSQKPIVSEKIGGLQLPATSTTTQVVSSGSEFDWGDAGIGAGVVFGTMLLGAGLVLTVRRRDFPIAH